MAGLGWSWKDEKSKDQIRKGPLKFELVASGNLCDWMKDDGESERI